MQSGDTVGYATSGCNPNGTQGLVDDSLAQECLLCLLGTDTSLSTSAYSELSIAGPAVLDGSSFGFGSISSTAPQSGYIGYRGTWNDVGTVTPTPTKLSATVPDPLASLPSPTSTAACSYADDENLSPGVYCGVTLDDDDFFGFGPVHYTLQPGTYYILGGMSLSGDVDVTATGSGVLLYFGCPQYERFGEYLGTCSAGESGGYLDISDGASLDLSAATTGSWAGVVAMFDRNDVGSTGTSCGFGDVALCLAGNDVSLGGTVYGASAPVYVNDNAAPTITGRLVASSLDLEGTFFGGQTLQLSGSAVTTPYCSIVDAVVGGGSSASIDPYSRDTDTLTLSGGVPSVGEEVALGGGPNDAEVLTVAGVSGHTVNFSAPGVTATGYTTAIWPASGQVVFQTNCSATGGSGSIDFNYTP